MVSRSIHLAALFGGGILAAALGGSVIEVDFNGYQGYQLDDGRIAAIVVPAIGRVMSFGWSGGPNLLWNADPASLPASGYRNHGGDKIYAGPHTNWLLYSEDQWPPPPGWDGEPHEAEILDGERVRMTTPVWPGFDVSFVREFRFEGGDLVIETTMQVAREQPMKICIWPVTQVNPPDAAFLPTDPASAYVGGWHWIGRKELESVLRVSPNLLRVTGLAKKAFKIGTDAPTAAIAAAFDDTLFLQRAVFDPESQYPDGAEGAGFPVEYYLQPGDYAELELLSPLYIARRGQVQKFTVRWSLHSLPNDDATSPAVTAFVEKLFKKPILQKQ